MDNFLRDYYLLFADVYRKPADSYFRNFERNAIMKTESSPDTKVEKSRKILEAYYEYRQSQEGDGNIPPKGALNEAQALTALDRVYEQKNGQKILDLLPHPKEEYDQTIDDDGFDYSAIPENQGYNKALFDIRQATIKEFKLGEEE